MTLADKLGTFELDCWVLDRSGRLTKSMYSGESSPMMVIQGQLPANSNCLLAGHAQKPADSK